jgi:hypothetical protein
MRFSFAADTNKKRKLTIWGFHAKSRPVRHLAKLDTVPVSILEQAHDSP